MRGRCRGGSTVRCRTSRWRARRSATRLRAPRAESRTTTTGTSPAYNRPGIAGADRLLGRDDARHDGERCARSGMDARDCCLELAPHAHPAPLTFFAVSPCGSRCDVVIFGPRFTRPSRVRRLGATRYETAHVLLGLARTARPATQTVRRVAAMCFDAWRGLAQLSVS